MIVPGRGSLTARYMIVGEAPGETEYEEQTPFVGRAGREQDAYLKRAGLHRSQFYLTNLVKLYIPGNPDPTPELIAEWGPVLDEEIHVINPRIIVPVGRFAIRYFLGASADMDAVHGIPHLVDGRIVIPCYHPAAEFYDDEKRPVISYDYQQVARAIANPERVVVPVDEFPDPSYIDVDWPYDFGQHEERVVGYDTEGDPSGYWGKVWFQVCFDPGCSLVFRQGSPHFDDNVRGFADWLARTGATLAIHNAMHDLEISRGIGLELFDVPIFDTQYAAYLLRVEPQGLKPLAYRHCGMRMASYQDTVGDIGLEKQLGYLSRILELSPWPKPEPELEYGNDGSCRLKTPQPVERRAEAILADYYSGKLDKDGNRTDPYDRWRKVVPQLRNMVELRMGRMPIGTLDDIPLDSAVFYAGRDPDATVRLYGALVKLLERNGLLQLMADGMAVYPVFEEMQASGMLATRQYFEDLGAEMWDKMCTLQAYISHHFWDGLPFNPASPPQVRELMRRRGLKGEKKTKTKVVSTGKKSVEHLRYTDDAMAHVIDWREHQKIRDSFCDPIIDRIGDRAEHRVRTTIKTTRTATRRVSASNPNLTAIPVRNELGLRVRGGFVAAPGCVLGSWDLSQVEMRYMAHLSGDDLLIRFLLEGRDPHAETASRIFGIPLADVQEMEHRYPAKRAGFGIITNIQGPGLLDQLRMFGCKGWTENKCDELITEWLKIYKGVAQLLKDCVREVQQNGMVRDEWGHIRYLPGVWSEDRKVRGEAERAASSHKIQGGAQGMIQKSMIWAKPIIRALQVDEPRLKWILQIHDELILEGPEDLMRDVVDPVIREALTEHSKKLVVPVKCSGSLGKTWGEL